MFTPASSAFVRVSRGSLPLLLGLAVGLTMLVSSDSAWARSRRALRPLALRLLQSWPLTDGQTAILSYGGKEFRFAPQSFWAEGTRVRFVNRFEPCLVEYQGGRPILTQVAPVAHEEDRKLAARFFSDLIEAGPWIWLLEQSTATIRRARADGTIDATWLLTEAEGAIITRFWPAGPAKFWLYDRGRGLLLLRSCENAPDPDRDAPGPEFPLSADSLAARHGHLVVADREGDVDWIITRRPAADPTAEPLVLATLEAEELRLLDVDETGTAFAYVRDRRGPALLRFVAGQGPERFALAGPWRFPADAGRIAQIVAPRQLLVLVMRRPDEIALAEVTLP